MHYGAALYFYRTDTVTEKIQACHLLNHPYARLFPTWIVKKNSAGVIVRDTPGGFLRRGAPMQRRRGEVMGSKMNAVGLSG